MTAEREKQQEKHGRLRRMGNYVRIVGQASATLMRSLGRDSKAVAVAMAAVFMLPVVGLPLIMGPVGFAAAAGLVASVMLGISSGSLKAYRDAHHPGDFRRFTNVIEKPRYAGLAGFGSIAAGFAASGAALVAAMIGVWGLAKFAIIDGSAGDKPLTDVLAFDAKEKAKAKQEKSVKGVRLSLAAAPKQAATPAAQPKAEAEVKAAAAVSKPPQP